MSRKTDSQASIISPAERRLAGSGSTMSRNDRTVHSKHQAGMFAEIHSLRTAASRLYRVRMGGLLQRRFILPLCAMCLKSRDVSAADWVPRGCVGWGDGHIQRTFVPRLFEGPRG